MELTDVDHQPIRCTAYRGHRVVVLALYAKAHAISNGVYQPSNITVSKGKKITLDFDRQDPAPCAETVIFPQLEDLSLALKMGQGNRIELPALSEGQYDFHCQMQMYKGKLIAE